MKTRDLILIILVIAVGYLIWKTNQPKQLVQGNNPVDKPLELEMKREPYAKQFTIESFPVQFPKVKPVNGTVTIAATSTNAGAVYLSPSYQGAMADSRYFAIEAGDAHDLTVTDLGDWYYYGTADDTFSVITEIENYG